jgi:hypothetical protein
MAKFAARDACKTPADVPTILEIKGLDGSHVAADEDSKETDPVQSLARIGSIAYIGNIPASKIRIAYQTNESRKWIEKSAEGFQEMRESDPLAALLVATSLRYPKAGDRVDGLTVRAHVPNLSSIDGYFADSKTLPGVRVVPMSDLGAPRSVFYAANDFARSEQLAEAIRQSGEINPLIIGVDDKGAFIIEGAHRFVAFHYLKVKEFPAVVVVGKD